MRPALIALLGVGLWEFAVQVKEGYERSASYAEAEQTAVQAGVPLVVIGCPKWGIHHGHGDYTLDIRHDSSWCRCPNPVTGDVCEIDAVFGHKSVVTYDSHVLEHLTPDEANLAIRALDRVAIARFHVWPSKLSVMAQLAPGHRSWPRDVTGYGDMVFEQRGRGNPREVLFNTGLIGQG